jgi:predicted MPP superfamily phosphohydrolase
LLAVTLAEPIPAAPVADAAKLETIQPALSSGYNFSIVHITDTQNISDAWVRGYEDPSITEYFFNLTHWITSNAQAYNVQMVIHTGDLINWPPDSDEQWTVASNCFMQFLDNDLPYCWCAGNHDQNPMDDPDGTCLASQYPAFNVNILRQKSYWVSDFFDAKNTAVQFTYEGYKFLIVDVEYEANSMVLEWMCNLLGNNSDANIIVGTHDFIDWNNVPTTDWARSFEAILDQYPNVFLTLNGHNTVEGYPASSHITVGNRTECYLNLQEAYNFTGAATARVYEFSLATNTVQALTYRVFDNQWATDSDYQFSFSVPFISQQPRWHLTTTVSPTGAGTTDPSGTTTVYGEINVTANPAYGYVFNHWNFDGAPFFPNPVTLPIQPHDTTHALTAYFDHALSLTVNTDRARYPKWSYVNISATVTDTNRQPLENAAVNITVTDTHNLVVWAENTVTDVAGKISCVYKLVFDAQMGTYHVTAQTANMGYENKTVQTNFYSTG